MNAPLIPPVDAELALAEIHARRAQVVGGNLVPGWFWTSVGGLILVFVAAVESHQPWLTAIGGVVYAVGLAATITLLVRRSTVQVRAGLLGVRGFLAIGGFSLVLVGAGVGLGFALESAGVPWPATLGCVPVALALAAGGPLLMGHLRRLMMARPPAGGSR